MREVVLYFVLIPQANEKLSTAKKSVNVMEQEKLIADALDVSYYCWSAIISCSFTILSCSQNCRRTLTSGEGVCGSACKEVNRRLIA